MRKKATRSLAEFEVQIVPKQSTQLLKMASLSPATIPRWCVVSYGRLKACQGELLPMSLVHVVAGQGRWFANETVGPPGLEWANLGSACLVPVAG